MVVLAPDQSIRPGIERPGGTAAIFSSGMKALPDLDEFLGFSRVLFRPGANQAESIDCVLTWGQKETGAQARRYAQRHKKPLLRIEDGLFRSVHPGRDHVPLSLVVDPIGIYYDARTPSELEHLLNGLPKDRAPERDPLQSEVLLKRAQELIDRVTTDGVSKYNNGSSDPRLLPTNVRVLLIDQTAGDASIEGALASEATFQNMLESALADHNPEQICIKLHPEVSSGKKRGYLSSWVDEIPGLQVCRQATAPFSLLDRVDEVFTVSSQMGFEALLAGKKVRCFGAPFYSGWGLTRDEQIVERRARSLTLTQLAAACWLLYPRYRNPITRRNCEAEEIVELLALQRRKFERNAGTTHVVGFSKWKRPAARAFLGGPDSDLKFLESVDLSEATLAPLGTDGAGTSRFAVWGQRGRSLVVESRSARQLSPLLTVEDGFLRSFELGSDLSLPFSLCVDDLGIYYDPTRPSRLETLLNELELSDAERAVAVRLREKIVASRITKYAVQTERTLDLNPDGRPVILVVGQVDDDASVTLGSPTIRSNAQLLKAARDRHPDAFLIYKPHPDVLAGNRKGALSDSDYPLADHVETEASILSCLDASETVATMTSLVGFEALLRGKKVETFGLPFYASWGLTSDMLSCERRRRRLDLDELVFGTLVMYPDYFDYERGYFCSAEQLLCHMESSAHRKGGDVRPSWGRKLRRLFRYTWSQLRER